MASTLTWAVKTVFGNKQVMLGTMTATDGTDAVATGLHWVDTVQVTKQTAAGTALGACVVINTAASGAGDIKLSTGLSGGVYHIMAIGN
jgi:hypothetical protein